MEHGREDQRWTLARIGRLIEERFGVTYEVWGAWRLEEAIAAWRTKTWPAASPPRRSSSGSRSRSRFSLSASSSRRCSGWVMIQAVTSRTDGGFDPGLGAGPRPVR
ncbi:winged helix-turn-helix domain-containing protein [Streptomyces sp. NPDC006476]|uniref:helix-turn-helix domain-containing protein n=1 Tax=Streptomyces sp. NPDC006476 TaxID=3157175 RepID=UPI0033A18007